MRPRLLHYFIKLTFLRLVPTFVASEPTTITVWLWVGGSYLPTCQPWNLKYLEIFFISFILGTFDHSLSSLLWSVSMCQGKFLYLDFLYLPVFPGPQEYTYRPENAFNNFDGLWLDWVLNKVRTFNIFLIAMWIQFLWEIIII